MNKHRNAFTAAVLAGATLVATAGVTTAQTTLPGDRLVYSGGAASDLYVTDLAAPPVAITSGPARDLAPDWSPDGTAIVFQRNTASGSDADLWVVGADGAGLRQLTRGRSFDRTPRWSPDGTRIVFSRRVGSKSSDLYVMNADGTGLKQLTKTFFGEGAPAWSPDGATIAYTRTAGSRPDTDVWTMRADGKGQKALVATRAVEGEPDYTPDGTTILFSRESGRIPRKPLPLSSPIRYNLDIWKVPAGGGARTRLTTRKGDDYGPRVSSDGLRYAYQAEIKCPGRACNTEVFIGRIDGSSPAVQVTNRSGLDWGGDWAPAPAS